MGKAEADAALQHWEEPAGCADVARAHTCGHMSHTHTHPSFTDITRPSAAANTTALALQLLQQRQLHAVIHIGDIA